MLDVGVEFDTELFRVRHLTDSVEDRSLIDSFSAGNNAVGLEDYLKTYALRFEQDGDNRTYLVIDAVTGELACYFALRSGLIPIPASGAQGYLSTLSAIELAYFAVNERYRRTRTTPRKIGLHVFNTFILPIARYAARIVGMRFLYIYALPQSRLISYYEKEMGFRRLPKELEKFLYERVKPDSDGGCVFMFQQL